MISINLVKEHLSQGTRKVCSGIFRTIHYQAFDLFILNFCKITKQCLSPYAKLRKIFFAVLQ